MTVGTKVVQVHADYVNTGMGGRVRYTAILGYLNTSLILDAETGLITVSINNHGFDWEVMPEYSLYVEGRDNDGTGNRAQVRLLFKLIDVNDETPIFEEDVYDRLPDATAPKNEVHYELINGNDDNNLALVKITGKKQTMTSSSPSAEEQNIFILKAQAYDLGVLVRSSTTTIRIYPPESRTRAITFVVPDIKGRSTVTATVLYDSSSVVDISQIQQRLSQHNSSFAIMTGREASTSETDTLYKAENKLLFWLLILLAILVALAIPILLLCSICSWSPLYGAIFLYLQ
ncbi:Cadherin-86C [Lucilia cuprina]|uniref:Cadherin-86C n=1 Tax=Lucilia cuprina TaxID=7375 RepID=A0A0L0C1C8_LUCCU|nr:Cadherin-86C [Lucilia cuprina]